jgi:hypothetical protein
MEAWIRTQAKLCDAMDEIEVAAHFLDVLPLPLPNVITTDCSHLTTQLVAGVTSGLSLLSHRATEPLPPPSALQAMHEWV